MDFWSGTSQGTSFELNSNYGERAQKWGDRDQNWGAEPVPVFGQAPNIVDEDDVHRNPKVRIC